MSAPVSAFLEAELREQVRRHGVVVWLDAYAVWNTFVDRLLRAAAELPYTVLAWRGSHLELMFELERMAGGADAPPLLIHLPGHNEETVRETPLCELYEAGSRFRRQLDSLLTDAAAGRVSPATVAAFVQAGVPSLEAADAWLAARIHHGEDGGLATHLAALRLPAIVDDLLAADGMLARRVLEAPEVLWPHLQARVGLTDAWRADALPSGAHSAEDVAFTLASHALAVEYTDDLKRPPVADSLVGLRSLPRAVIDACRDLAAHLRTVHPAFYQRTADETEAWLEDEAAAARAEDLGRIDTFRFEEERVLEAALDALAEDRWDDAREWTEPRADGGSFWVGRDPTRRAAWQLLSAAARLGEAIRAAGPNLVANDVERAIAAYTDAGAAVDQAHRHLEQRRTALLFPHLPMAARVREVLDYLRTCWWSWADAWADGFNRLCKRRGFLPTPSSQQRTLFDEVVGPLTREGGVVALFVVDALRYEMADELLRAIDGTPATFATLSARLAELPTITEVGMNAIAPASRRDRLTISVRDGRVEGFSAGEFRIDSPRSRQRAMAERVGGAACPWLTLAEVHERDVSSLRQAIARARLVVVASDEIDAAGESGVGTAVFDVVMQKLRAAWIRLREAGVRRFVFTADHGYLLLDATTSIAQPHGRRIDPKRRHVISTVAADHDGEARVALADLGYDGADGLHLMFPLTTRVFDTGARGMTFVHGGNSLQERVIPVLVVTHRNAVGGDTLRYAVRASAAQGVAQLLCLEASVDVVADGQLAFGGNRVVELALRVTDDPSVQVELCQARGGATLHGAAIEARVGQTFELFFRLTGPTETRVQIELFHASGAVEVASAVVETRFPVSATLRPPPTAAPTPPPTASEAWLDAFEGGDRQLFAHLAAHGSVTEEEAMGMLGGARALRRFSSAFEALAARAPFNVRVESIAGIKRYVREGSPR